MYDTMIIIAESGYTGISHQLCKLSRTKPKRRKIRKYLYPHSENKQQFFLPRESSLTCNFWSTSWRCSNLCENGNKNCSAFVYLLMRNLFPKTMLKLGVFLSATAEKFSGTIIQLLLFRLFFFHNPNCNRLSTARFFTDI